MTERQWQAQPGTGQRRAGLRVTVNGENPEEQWLNQRLWEPANITSAPDAHPELRHLVTRQVLRLW